MVQRFGLLMSVVFLNSVPFGQKTPVETVLGIWVADDILEVMVRVLRPVLGVGVVACEAICVAALTAAVTRSECASSFLLLILLGVEAVIGVVRRERVFVKLSAENVPLDTYIYK